MSAVTADAIDEEVVEEAELSLVATLVAALVVGTGLVLTARAGATPLLIAVAVTQALLAAAWVFGTGMPGRRGALVIATLAAAGADAAASVWPDGRLGTLLPVLGLAVPAMFAHQLMRGAARVQVVSSLAAVALLVLGEVALAAMLQLRHEFGTDLGGKVSSTVAGAIAGALVIGCLVDLLLPAPRFDSAVPRGLLGLIAAIGLGGSVGYLLLRDEEQFGGGRGTFTGAALGALAGLLAVAIAFVLHTTPQPPTTVGRRLRPVLGAVLPIAIIAPAAFLLCLAIRV
ncbi:MAG: hypothetical protein QOI15_3146 [Pseudonocardiales bacterium]|jgi:hypothetical protein|nr:hypothetical protein [Pseudonocardiales bacterium]MDT4922244.1 hypothetical protein [Pseudonocardiales bacterium]